MGQFSDRKSADDLRIVRTLAVGYKQELFPTLNFQHQQFVYIFFVLPDFLFGDDRRVEILMPYTQTGGACLVAPVA